MNRAIMLAGILMVVLSQAVVGQQLAFPGADGFGKHATGGRGGEVIYVTNLNDSGPGSLRAAIETKGPRTVVFEVSGTIVLEDDLAIDEPYITIAGQTAPGDGLAIRDGSLEIGTHNVIVRYLRVRLGDQGEAGDAISIQSGHDIIVDHCSSSWSTDEVLSASTDEPDLSNVTVQWSFITEALNPEDHGYGSLIRGTGGVKYSFHHNLYAHNRGRNPRPGNYDSNPHDEDPEGLLLDFRNNVIYNWGGGHAGYNADSESVTKLNYVGNFLIPGVNSETTGIAYETGSPFNKTYFYDNYYDVEKPENPWELVAFDEDWSQQQIEAYKQNKPFSAGAIKTDAPKAAFEKVLSHGGASQPNRDVVDERIVNDVKNRTGAIIDSQNEVGGWPELESTSAPTDTDRDGMPDQWEEKHDLDPAKDADAAVYTISEHYTNLEVYLNHLVNPANRK
jgi:pectate lyase